MKVIILAGGKGSRWGNYLGVKKQHIEINGERLIDRTIRLCTEHSQNNEVLIADRTDTTDAYKGSKPVGFNDDDQTTKFHDSLHLWEKDESVALLYGDVWYSELGLNKILSYTKAWAIAGRHGASRHSGCLYGELFGFVCNNYGADLMRKTIIDIGKLKRSDCKTGSQLVRNLWGIQELLHPYDRAPHMCLSLEDRETFMWITTGHFIEIDDWTEDFDLPEDYDRYMIKRGYIIDEDEQAALKALGG